LGLSIQKQVSTKGNADNTSVFVPKILLQIRSNGFNLIAKRKLKKIAKSLSASDLEASLKKPVTKP
jgi:hypothetical protein